MRSLFAAAGVLVRRRARRDVALLIGWILLVCFTVLLTAGVPGVLIGTVDQGARQAVSAAGSRADVLVQASVGQPGTPLRYASPEQVIELARDIPSRLPSAMKQVFAASSVEVLSPRLETSLATGDAPPTHRTVQLGMLTPDSVHLPLVTGRMPEDTSASAGSAIEVVVSAAEARAAAQAAGAKTSPVGLGSVFEAPLPPSEPGGAAGVRRFIVVGILAAPDGVAAGGPSRDSLTLLATAEGIARSEALFIEPLDATIRLRLDPSAFTNALEARVSDEVAGLPADTARLAGDSTVALRVNSEFVDALSDYPRQARAAVAQMSLMVAGVLGAAATVILLFSRLLVVRRTGELALERARGASLASMAIRAAVESVLATIVGGALGLGLAALLFAGDRPDAFMLGVVLLIAVLATPLQSVMLARGLWRGRREPANRQDRAKVRARAASRRLVIELGVVALAAGALVSLRGRGLLETSTDAVDPLLLAAPLLLALVISLVVLRLYPGVMRAVAALGRRSRGALGVLGAARAGGGLAVLPLLALTLSVALAVGGGLLIDTVRSGQEQASWQRIGAEVRVEAPVTPNEVARVAHASGVTAVGSAYVAKRVDVRAGPSLAIGALLAVDGGYADVLASAAKASKTVPAPELGGLRKLGEASASQPLPAVVDSELASQLVSTKLVVHVGDSDIPLKLVGVVDAAPDGYLDGPYLYVDLQALSARMPEPLTANSLLAMGPGAPRAAATLDVARSDIHTRVDWLKERRHFALVTGVGDVMLLSVGAVALLAVMALVASVIAGTRSRVRALSLLRTLGVGRGATRWLALADVAPVVLAAVVGGIIAGIGTVMALGPSLGLDVLAGGLDTPTLRISPAVIAAVVGGTAVLLVLAMLAEFVIHRRDRLSEVLRVGETV